ncbi:MAG: amidohydrolase family protein [Archangium sp.]|nr:amidohydrolase family protein [Archangium sp.]
MTTRLELAGACCMAAPALARGMKLPLPALDDEEGPRVPQSLPPVVDAHVHLFPDGVFEALWKWFDQYGWPIRYKLHAPKVIDFLFSRGVSKLVALHYAHRPGMARMLNEFVAQLAANDARIIGMATVLPGEEGAPQVLRDAFALGLKGLKLHCHVQSFSADEERMHELYEVCVEAGKPLVMHAGREPSSSAYPVDVYSLCGADRVERALQAHPRLKLCVPHLGADEFDAYTKLLERYDNLWLDTTMVASNYFALDLPRRIFEVRPDRILYGTDFPNLPYAWDRELKTLVGMKFRDDVEAGFLGQNALRLYEGA